MSCGHTSRTPRPAEWLPSAEGAGCVDTVVFRDGGDSVPLGANVTADAFIDLFAQFGIEPNGTTLVHGAGHSARSLITALESLEASRILVYDPRRRNLAAIAENVQATGVRKGLVEVVDDPAAALKVADGLQTVCTRRRVHASKYRAGRFSGGSTDLAESSVHTSKPPASYYLAGV